MWAVLPLLQIQRLSKAFVIVKKQIGTALWSIFLHIPISETRISTDIPCAPFSPAPAVWTPNSYPSPGSASHPAKAANASGWQRSTWGCLNHGEMAVEGDLFFAYFICLKGFDDLIRSSLLSWDSIRNITGSTLAEHDWEIPGRHGVLVRWERSGINRE